MKKKAIGNRTSASSVEPQQARAGCTGGFQTRPYLAILVVVVSLALGVSRVQAAELPTVEVGLPQDGLFGLGGQYVLDKGLDRKNGFVMKPRWAGVPEIQRLLGIKAISVGLMTPEAGLRANLRDVPIRFLNPTRRATCSRWCARILPISRWTTLKERPSL